MTRYARAKGSKASNERLPEEATPWHIMQQQMLNQCHGTHENQRESTSSTDEENKKYITDEKSTMENKLVTWTSFGNENEVIYNKNEVRKMNKTVKKQENKNINKEKNKHSSGCEKLKSSQTDLKMNTKCMKVSEHDDNTKRNLHDLDGVESNIKKEQLFSKKHKVDNTVSVSIETASDKDNKEFNCKSQKSVQMNMYRDKKLLQGKFKQSVDKNKKHFGQTSRQNNLQSKMSDSESFTMYCNGKPVQVVHYDGFLIKEKDAEELNKLKLQLIAKGIPRNEYLAVLKLERRKAEKALVRERKNVCYRCRKSGHNFSECPETDGALGYCFKCGSTEHTHSACKVNRGEDYRYAQCFLCKEQGHIAKQCPDNPRGLYPKGGACHLCGDVTHFKKDCPKNVEDKEKNTVTVKTFNKNFVEALDEELNSKARTKKMTKNKIVNF